MKITVVQPDLAWESKQDNFAGIQNLLAESGHDPDIVILPEMFTTGFTMNASGYAEKPYGETFAWMVSMAEKGNTGICGSYIVADDGIFFNRWVFVTPQGNSWHYDKKHLFSIGGEEKVYTPGKERLIFSFRGARISAYVCYDLRFPVWSRNLKEYDIMINSASWPEARQEVWNTLLKARAIENQCYVVGANRIGIDGNGVKHCGESQIISPKGEIICLATRNAAETITADISLQELEDFRNKFPVLDDADDFRITF